MTDLQTEPEELKAALRADAVAGAAFIALPLPHRREYVRWIGEAETDETRWRRAAEAVAQLKANAAREGRDA